MSQEIIRKQTGGTITYQRNDIIGLYKSNPSTPPNGYVCFGNADVYFDNNTDIINYYLYMGINFPSTLLLLVTPKVYTVDYTIQTFTCSGHGLVNNQYIEFEASTVYPAPLLRGQTTGLSYRVTVLSSSTFTLPDITLTSNGTGTKNFYRGFRFTTSNPPDGWYVKL
jgi:hypothetical protein